MRNTVVESALDTGAANPYIWAYLEVSARHAGMDEDQREALRDALQYALDMYTAAEAYRIANG